MINFNATSKFEKEFKKLLKKYKTLDDDLEDFKKVLLKSPTGFGKNFVIIHSSLTIDILKARMACRQLKSRSLRIVYSHLKNEERIEFIELYFKGNKENEDRGRIDDYLKSKV